MPLVIPPFTQFQGTLFPLRGLWFTAPAEGDRFITAEIDWGTYPPGQAVQFQLSGNSPVALTQIIALTVDNAGCGSDIQFVFADSGFVLQVPAACSGVYPVFTNGLNFYVVALNAAPNDVTNIHVHNSLPPPIPIQISRQQNIASVGGIALTTPGSTQIVDPSVNGTLNSMSLIVSAFGLTGANSIAQLTLSDSRGVLWTGSVTGPADSSANVVLSLPDTSIRFFGGLSLRVEAGTNFTAGDAIINVYYTVP
jgi:hypothetical protein